MNPDVLIVGDLHIHERQEFPGEIGKNPRLLDGLDILDQILRLVIKHELRYVIFTGDLFELKDRIPNHILVPFAQIFEEINLRGAEVIALMGNHDFKIPEYATTSIFPNIRLVCDPETLELKNDICSRTVGFLPFFRKEEDFRQNWLDYHQEDAPPPDIFIFHNELPGVYYSKKKMSEQQSWDFPTFPYDSTMYIGGHIHMPQILKTTNNQIEFIGTPYQIDFTDVDKDRANYVILYELSTGKTESVQLNYPRFLGIDLDSKENPNLMKAKGNYLRIVGTVEPKDRPRIRELKQTLLSRGAKGVQIKVKYLTQQVKRLKAEKTDHRGVIGQYLLGNTTGLDKERLLRTGLELIEKVK